MPRGCVKKKLKSIAVLFLLWSGVSQVNAQMDVVACRAMELTIDFYVRQGAESMAEQMVAWYDAGGC